ncbi:cytochrome P450 family protein [Dactylosporangium sp. McL0621]|uniref:cytochrome P450 family protein n=1 Tax=Dactylosporangium sp. McL0621 TaxID=3415678 RepID=UPI003CF7E942
MTAVDLLPDPFAAEHDADPYAYLAGLREAAPVHRARTADGRWVWFVTRYAEARALLADPRMSRDPRNAGADWLAANRANPTTDPGVMAPHVGITDGADHARLRRLVSGVFAPGPVRAMRAHVDRLAHGLVDALAGRDETDLVTAFAEPLPAMVICELLGVPEGDRGQFRGWIRAVVADDTQAGPEESARRRQAAVGNLFAYFDRLIAEARRAPGEGLVSTLAAEAADGDRLSEPELRSMLFVLLIGGYETTLGFLATSVLHLLADPGRWRALHAEPGRCADAVEELLRYDGSVKTSFWIFPTEPVRIAGVELLPGDPVMVSFAAANRDPAANAEPDRLLLGRSDARHLAFGHGPHYCLGAPLARVEASAGLAALAARCPGLTLAVPPREVRWQHSPIVRAPLALPVHPGRVLGRSGAR